MVKLTEIAVPPAPAPVPVQAPAPKTPAKPGPESKITLELVQRVSNRVAKGIPIKVALSGESVTHSAYKKHLQRHPELRSIQSAAKVDFLDKTFEMILSRPGPMLRWLLERRHSDIFGSPPGGSATVKKSAVDVPLRPAGANSEADVRQIPTIAGFSQEALEEARRHAQNVPPNA